MKFLVFTTLTWLPYHHIHIWAPQEQNFISAVATKGSVSYRRLRMFQPKNFWKKITHNNGMLNANA